MKSFSRSGVLSAALLGLGSCGAGTAGIVAGSSGSGGSSSTPVIETFEVRTPKVSPAGIELRADRSLTVALAFQMGGGAQPMSLIPMPAVAGNEVSLVAGDPLTVSWDFETDLGSTGFEREVQLLALFPGTGDVLSGGGITRGIGNDAPRVVSIDQIDIDPDEDQASGTTGIEFLVEDSSDDIVSVKVEFDIQGDTPDAGWQLARPPLLDPGLPTPEFGVSGVRASKDGTRLSFFWDTNAATDLEDLERDVRIRLTPWDGFAVGSSVSSMPFRVDNNAEPIVQIDSGPFATNPDELRGIPVPFRVFDDEGDQVDVIFQWRHQGEEFPALPIEDVVALDAILEDPLLRKAKHICTSLPHYATGAVVPFDLETLRLPELASEEAWILPSGMKGRTIELLRPSRHPEPVADTWPQNPLVRPVAALPLGDGLSALVADSAGGVRVHEIELATGRVLRDFPSLGPGLPGPMAIEHSTGNVLVASAQGSAWRIDRIDLSTGGSSELATDDGSGSGPVRGMASIGPTALAFTLQDCVWLLDYRDRFAPALTTLSCNLSAPWGVALDPLDSRRLYIAERGANRILVFDLGTRGVLPLTVRESTESSGGLSEPSALAFGGSGTELHVVTAAPDGSSRLSSVFLGPVGRNEALHDDTLPKVSLASVATGPDGLLLLSVPDSHDLLVGGGVEQRRRISALDPQVAEGGRGRQLVRLDAPLSRQARPSQPWRVSANPPLAANQNGQLSYFLWDSADAAGGTVFLQAIARDSEAGVPSGGAAGKVLRPLLDVTPLRLGNPLVTRNPSSVAAGDLDADGDLDLVVASEGSSLAVFFQQSPGAFSIEPLELTGFPFPGLLDPCSVATGDVDRDGLTDIVACWASDALTVFFQTSPESYASAPIVLNTPPLFSSSEVRVADMDADGDLDIVGHAGGEALVYLQTDPRRFDREPLAVGECRFPPAVVDLDLDGDLDLASADADGLVVFRQTAPGSFSREALVPFEEPFSSSKIAALDVDLDGDVDFLRTYMQRFPVIDAPDRNLHKLQIILDRAGEYGIDTFELGIQDADFPPPLEVIAADIDGDQDFDFLVGCNNLGSPCRGLRAVYQMEPGAFRLSSFGNAAGNIDAVSLGAADLNGDGRMDAFSANKGGDEIVVFQQGAPGHSFSPGPVLDLQEEGGPTLCVGDLNGDGLPDLASNYDRAIPDTFAITLFFQDAAEPGSFPFDPVLLGGRPLSDPLLLAVGDIDSDGDMDLAASMSSGFVKLFMQESPGVFGLDVVDVVDIVSRGPLESLEIVDLDGDGLQDVLAFVPWYQDADVGFAQGTTSFGDGFSCGDVDLDGDLDVVAGSSEGAFDLFEQVSPRVFERSSVDPGTTARGTILVVDFDHDGAVDVYRGGRVHYQGPTGFSSAAIVGGSPGLDLAATEDFDRDGRIDLALLDREVFPSSLRILAQVVPRRFEERARFEGPVFGIRRFTVDDVDVDGEVDVVLARGGNLEVFFGGR